MLGLDVLCCQSLCYSAVYVDLPGRRLTRLQTVSQGAFGYIDLASYETNEEGKREVYVKRPILAGRSLLMEACVQMKVRECLMRAGFSAGAPRVLRIFRLSDRSVCFAMDPIDGATTMDHVLASAPPSKRTSIIVDCLLQLCSMVWHLANDLGLNHRDLKPSNFLLVERPAPIMKVITVDTEILQIASSYSLTLIDFGFSCMGTPETQVSSLSLSYVYSQEDPCPKEGRDIFLFIGLLYMEFYDSLTEGLRVLFEQWLDIPHASVRVCEELRKAQLNGSSTEQCSLWLYGIAGHEEIKSFACCPLRIVKDLQRYQSR